ncbi:iron-containing redox enzyme family protein [Massilia antarctica]|uniref:Iron-containing redox enzyme family protein n=1 Tax=Massilia antarctica TaxID=2765360 RepID=A0AA48WBT9_9BURK|nr:iron-containing redox enzyme family protein [Massilia antarctica]QPI48637.1 iron-containing redox enzyme family protein [Massilia antarctica]
MPAICTAGRHTKDRIEGQEVPSASSQLRRKIHLCKADTPLDRDDQVGIAHYRDYLCYLHQTIRASIPLMACAIERCSIDRPVELRLRAYLARHIEEEAGHAELLMDDLITTGLSREQVLSLPPGPAVTRMVGAQYYWILHHSPFALLGYIAFLEGTPPTAQALDFWKTATGLPPAAFCCLVLHAGADPRHWRELDCFIDSLPLPDSELALIGQSAMQTAQLAGDAWHALKQGWGLRP